MNKEYVRHLLGENKEECLDEATQMDAKKVLEKLSTNDLWVLIQGTGHLDFKNKNDKDMVKYIIKVLNGIA